jgi:hypothetical protein
MVNRLFVSGRSLLRATALVLGTAFAAGCHGRSGSNSERGSDLPPLFEEVENQLGVNFGAMYLRDASMLKTLGQPKSEPAVTGDQ